MSSIDVKSVDDLDALIRAAEAEKQRREEERAKNPGEYVIQPSPCGSNVVRCFYGPISHQWNAVGITGSADIALNIIRRAVRYAIDLDRAARPGLAWKPYTGEGMVHDRKYLVRTKNNNASVWMWQNLPSELELWANRVTHYADLPAPPAP